MNKVLKKTVQGRSFVPLTCSLSHDGGPATQLSAAYYNELGQVMETELLEAAATVSYGYNVRGWVSSISCGNLFSQTLHYADAPSGATARYGGDASANYWRCGTSELVGMKYQYDGLGRLTDANSLSMASDYTANFTYDRNGNLTHVRRLGLGTKIHVVDPDFGDDYYQYNWDVIDNVTLTYDGNQLKTANDTRPTLTYEGAMDFRDGADATTEYLWDADGRMTQDKNKGIYEVEYNLIGLPSKTHFYNGNIIYSDYAADGRRLQTRYVYDSNEVAVMESQGMPPEAAVPAGMDGLFAGMASVPGGGIEPEPLVQLLGKRDYCGSHIYLNDTIERVLTPVGYYNELGDHYAYVKDWQGNVRVTVDQNGIITEAVDYYPYGMLIAKANRVPTDVQPYKYGGKELDRRFGLDSYDFEARIYDPALGRFTQPDPLAWDTPEVSPYVYCAANPIRYVDPSGMDIAILNLSDDLIRNQHLALLIQDDDGKWKYYSMNGDIIYEATNGSLGGKYYHDKGEKSFDSPQAFLESNYNREGNVKQISENQVAGYNFSEAYVISTTKAQDKAIRETFIDIVDNEEYKLFGNNCAIAVQRSIEAGNVKSVTPKTTTHRVPDNFKLGESGFDVTYSNMYIKPSNAFKSIIRLNPDGKHYYKNSQ